MCHLNWKLMSSDHTLKKPTLDPEVLANYRPISNLPFLSKVLEKIVAAQLQIHLKKKNCLRNSSLVSALATALKLLWWGLQTICWCQQMLALHLFSSYWIWLQHSALWITAFFCIVYVTPSVSLTLFITGFHPTLLGEWNMLPWERLNPWHTMSPVVSLKAQWLALFCLYYIYSLSVMSSAGMEYHFIVMLTTLNFT